jgi:hypothetical protein
MKEKETAPTNQRSWMEAYGSVTALSIVIVVVLIVIFSSTPAAIAPKTDATPIPEEEYYAKKTQDTDKIIKEAVEKSGGDWNKIPPAGQQRIQELSQGHGKEMIQMYFERMKTGKSAPLPSKDTPKVSAQ